MINIFVYCHPPHLTRVDVLSYNVVRGKSGTKTPFPQKNSYFAVVTLKIVNQNFTVAYFFTILV